MKKLVALVALAALVAFAAPALAANPFMDVPMNNWAYDAISQLSASGIVSGYPDGTFKGNQPMTRYEMASIVGRALATVDMNKASKQDVEMLKKLVVEFKDELDSLGVKVDKLDSRVAVLEENLGGWKIAGGFRFDYNDVDTPTSGLYKDSDEWNDQDNTLSRARLHFYKTINENVKFYGRLNGEEPEWSRYRIDVKLPYDFELTVGKFCWDWEDNLYWVSPPGSWQTDSIISDIDPIKGFHLTKEFSMGSARFIISRNDADSADQEYLMYGADFNFHFNEMFATQIAYVGMDPEAGDDISTWWIAPTVDFGNGLGLKGAFYQQDNDREASLDDSANLWKAIFTVDQDVTNFSSFWIEYMDAEKGFFFNQAAAYDFVATPSEALYDGISHSCFDGFVIENDINVFQVMAAQQWSDKWDTWFRYADYDLDTNGDATNYTVGIDYLYSDAVRFELLYDDVDADDDSLDDSMINFRTAVYF